MAPAVRSVLDPGRVRVALRTFSFWGAVVLPVVAIGLLVLTRDPVVVLPILAGNAVALVLGHDHRHPSGSDRATTTPARRERSPRPNHDH
jgi:hypothetical protein